MKPIIHQTIGLCMGAFICLTACDVHEFPEPVHPTPPEPGPESVKCELHLNYEERLFPIHANVIYGISDRSRAGAPYDYRYLVNIYEGLDEGSHLSGRGLYSSLVTTVTTEGLDTPDCVIPLDLPPGDYTIVAWSDFVDGGTPTDRFYDCTDFSAITILATSGHPGNIEEREAFRGYTSVRLTPEDLEATAEGKVVRIEADMERPLARFRFITTDLEEFQAQAAEAVPASASQDTPGKHDAPSPIAPSLSDYDVRIIYAGYMPVTYNAFTDMPVDAILGQHFRGVIKGTEAGGKEAELGFDHVFVNHAEGSVQLGLQIYRRADGLILSQTDAINVPLKRGHLTEIRGRFLTTSANSGVGISPDFDGEYNIEIR